MTWLITTYGPKRIFWLIRFNIVFLRDVRSFEMTAGLLGYGVLLLVQKSKVRNHNEQDDTRS